MATNIVGATGIDKVQDGIIVNADIDTVAASKLTGALPAISGASLTNIPAANITGTLPALAATNLTSIPAANITGTLPAISGASLTNVNAVNGGRKNMVINGAMNVAQRGTSSTSNGYATVDRFFTYKENTDQITLTQFQHDNAPPGFGRSWKVDVGTSENAVEANDLIEAVTRLEGQDLQHLKWGTSSAQSVTLSFWIMSSNTGTYVVNLYNRVSARNITATYTISVADTWEHKTMTFPGDTVAGFTWDNNRALDIVWKLMAGSNFTGTASTTWGTNSDARTANGISNNNWGTGSDDTWYLSGVQLEVGSVATDFEHRSYGEELALCERYFQEFVCSHQEWIYVEGTNTTHKWWQISYRGMRAAPTFTASSEMIGVSSGNVGGGNVVSLSATATLGRASVRVTMSNTSGTVHGIHHIDAWSGDSCFLDAEL
jgi:hypothetical protein